MLTNPTDQNQKERDYLIQESTELMKILGSIIEKVKFSSFKI